ncbi:DUF2634 domain-containing protein [Alkalihalobacillus trypoxylicola]|uniref:Phage portal protein n=1 Tax=Alkalihalobacillus trypoxylicola TaxID=519424 RepID=A0A162EWB4_9BACI|nr:DUF2634 domain-containing protein [Alkalihalobacillus trypoxylicola]KYG33888.1 phage portal protein [Alkalihalobacillus trypoxylicola]
MLSPEVEISETVEGEEFIEPSNTYAIDFVNGRIESNHISGLEAIKQFVYMVLRTARYAYPIYSHDIGNELEETLADKETTDVYKEMEIPRLIEESLIYDERIISVQDFAIIKREDAFYVSFVVETDEGSIELEEVINVA